MEVMEYKMQYGRVWSYLLAFSLLALMPVSPTNAQSFPTDSAEWSIAFTAFNLPPNGGYTTTTIHYGLRGDTLIDGMAWSKLYEDTAATDMAFMESHAMLIGAIREDANGQVRLQQDGSTFLLFDFSLTVGDQFTPLGPYGYVSAVDTVFLGGAWRRHFAIDPGFALWPLEYMEGIGYIHGQGVMDGWRYWNVGVHIEFELLCMDHHGVRIYGFGPCHVEESTVPTQVPTNPDPVLSLFPSPFTDSFTIRSDKPLNDATIVVCDATGRTVLQHWFNGTWYRVDGAHLAPGLYVVSILNSGTLIQRANLIAQ